MRKLLALLLTLAMVLSLASVAVVATPAGEPITSAAELGNMDEGGDYYLANDIHIGSSSEEGALITIPAGVTLDGNGKTIYNDYYTAEPEEGASKSKAWTHVMFQLSAGAQITLKNLKIGSEALPVHMSNGSAAAAGNFTVNDTYSIFDDVADSDVVWENVDFFLERKDGTSKNIVHANTGAVMFKVLGNHAFADCELNGYIKAGSQQGGWIYNLTSSATVTMTNCDIIGTLYGSYVGGFAHTVGGTLTMTDCDSDVTINSVYNTNQGQAGGFVYNAVGAMSFTGCNAKGTILSAGYAANFVYKTGKAGDAANPSIAFTNCVNSGSFTTASEAGGFMRELNTGKDVYVTFTNCVNAGDIKSATAGGFICNQLSGSTAYFVNCTNSGAVTATNYKAAGYVAQASSGKEFTAIGCVNSGTITSEKTYSDGRCGMGGFVAHNSIATTFYMEDCINTGTINGKGNSSGGLTGYTEGAATVTLVDCANYGTVLAGSHNGGLMGCTKPASLTRCFNYGRVEGPQWSGGLIGKNQNAKTTINNYANYGEVIGVHAVAGLVAEVGYALEINNSLNAGDVHQGTSAGEGIGGFIGRIADNKQAISVSNSANLGVVTGSTKNGAWGAFGDTFGQFMGCYTISSGSFGYGGDKTIQGFFDWSADGVVKPTFTNCYAYGDAVVADGAKSLTGFVGNDAEGTSLGSGKGIASTIDVEDAPNNGLYGINVEATLSNCQTLDAAATAATTLNNLKLFPVTFKADNGAVVVDEAPALKGYQQTADKKTIRFAATLNDLASVTSAGFTYTVKVNGATVIDNVSKNVNQVLYSGNETNAGVTSKVLAANNGGQYFYTLTFVNVPTNATVVFTVQATVNGVAQGEAVTLTFVNGEYQAPQA